MVASPDIEISVDNGFISFFDKLDQTDERLIRLFDRSRNEGDVFYTCHGKDAIWVAENVYGTNTVLKYYGGKSQQPSVSLKQATANEMIKDLLLKRNFKIEVWECDNRMWLISKKASPGNLRQVEDMLFSNSDLTDAAAPVVACIHIEYEDNQKMVGVAFTDASSGQVIGVSQFLDTDDLSNLESILIQQGAKECVIVKDAPTQTLDQAKLISLVERLDLVCTKVKVALFNKVNIVQDMNRLLETDLEFQTLPEYELNVAQCSIACLISYLQLLTDDANIEAYSIKKIDLNQYMKLDASAVKAFNLMPGIKDGNNKTTHLFGILNKCKTAQGSRMLGQFIKQPLMNIDDIKSRHKLVSLFFNDSSLSEMIQETSLKAFPDLHRLAKKFQRGKANLQDVIRIYQVVQSLPNLKEQLDSFSGENSDLLTDRFIVKLDDFNERLEKLKELVETTVDLEASNYHEYKIKADFDPALLEMKERIDEIVNDMKSEAKKAAYDLDLEFEKKVKFEFSPQYGHHLRVSRNDAGKFRDNNKYIVYKTVKAGALFTTKTIKRLAEEQGNLEKEYSKLQSNTAKEVIQITGTYFPVLEECNFVIAELDVFLSLASAARKAPVPYVCPEMAEGGDLILTASRHPCVELQDDVSFIENDVKMTRDSFFSIITGPNMGGKSTFIRQIGLITLMAQIGSFVPCSFAKIPIIDAVLARVGAGDSQLKGISTFMAEMLETAAILRVATDRSLIIIDELGRGTSTKDGFGLAWAIAEHVAQKLTCFTLFATHFHEITSLSNQYSGVENYHVQALVSEPDAQIKTLTLLYKVLPGVCDQSFGIHVAELAEFPDIVIQMAKRKASELEGFDVDKDKQLHSQKKWKSSKQEIQMAGSIIEKFLERVKKEGWQQVDSIRSEFGSEFAQHPFLQEVIHEF